MNSNLLNLFLILLLKKATKSDLPEAQQQDCPAPRQLEEGCPERESPSCSCSGAFLHLVAKSER